MKDIIEKILESHQDINLSSSYARELLAEEITKQVKSHIEKAFLEEYNE